MYYVIGIILIIIGIIINVSINRRRFYRRSPTGLQQFKTFGGAVLTTWSEKLGKLLAMALILLGLFVLATGYYVNVDKEKRDTKLKVEQQRK